MKRRTARPLSPRRSAERGFVLLLVFAMAAGVAVMLYLEMPRVTFQHQRNKEAMLVDRGEQYKRALELYVKKYNRFPQSIDQLEKPDNVRLLRRRYKDPMTGKDEWRLIHIDNSGQYIDSLVHKKEEEKKERHLLEADVQGIGASATSHAEEQSGPSPFLQRTASDRIIPGPGGGGGAGAPPAPGAEMSAEQTSRSGPPPPPDPSLGEGMPGAVLEPGGVPTPFSPPGSQIQPAGSPFQPVPLGAQAQPESPFGQTQVQPGPNMPGQMLPGQLPPAQAQPEQSRQQGAGGGGFGFGGGFGMGAGSAAPAAPQPFSPAAPGGMPNPVAPQAGRAGGMMGGGPQPGVVQQGPPAAPGMNAAPPATANEALRMIQSQLARPTAQAAGPRQGGSGQQGQQQGTLAGGVAGVASTLDLEGIMVYKERTNYKEWEFLADLNRIRGGRAGGAAPGQAGQPGQPGVQRGQPGQPGMQGAPAQGGAGFGGSGFGAGRPGQQPGGMGAGQGAGAGRPSTPPAGGTGGGSRFGSGAQPQPRR